MEVILHIKSEISAVFLLNGAFVEKPDKVIYRSDEPLYVSILPLDAIYLPYTVKLLKGKPLNNEPLAESFVLNENRILIRLKGRFNYVYSPSAPRTAKFDEGVVPHFFRLVKEQRFVLARENMTKELSAGLTDEALTDFFNEFCDITENVYTPEKGWYLLREGVCARCDITLRSGLIDNFIVQ